MESIKRIFRKGLPKASFARSVGVLLSGTIAAQLLLVIIAPILTRLYTPEDFGVLAVYTSLLTVLLLCSTLRYDIAIPLPEEESEAVSLVVLSLVLIAFFFALTGSVVFLLADEIGDVLGVPEISGFLWLLPFGILFGGVYNVFNQWSVRTKHFGVIASTKLRQALITILIQLGGYKWGAFTLLLGQLASQGVGATRLSKPRFESVRRSDVFAVANKYQRFAKFSTPAGIVRVAGVELPALVLAAVFSPAAAGIYALTNRVLAMPARLVGGAVSQVFVANAAEAYRNQNLGLLTRDVHAKMAQVGMPLILLLMVLGPELFGFIFGSSWRQAGEFACWLAPWLYLVFVSSPLTNITAVMGHQKRGLQFHLVLFVLRLGALYIGVLVGDVETTVILLAIVNGVWRLIFLIWLFCIAGNTFNSFLLDSGAVLIKSFICAAPVLVSVLFFYEYWFYALIISVVMITISFFQLLKRAY